MPFCEALPPCRGRRAHDAGKDRVRKLGGPVFGQGGVVLYRGPHREGDEPKPMMHEHRKSDIAIVAVRAANKAERSAAERVEPRAVTEGKADKSFFDEISRERLIEFLERRIGDR